MEKIQKAGAGYLFKIDYGEKLYAFHMNYITDVKKFALLVVVGSSWC